MQETFNKLKFLLESGADIKDLSGAKKVSWDFEECGYNLTDLPKAYLVIFRNANESHETKENEKVTDIMLDRIKYFVNAIENGEYVPEGYEFTIKLKKAFGRSINIQDEYFDPND